VSVGNRTVSRVDEVVEKAGELPLVGCHDAASFVASLERPRRAILLVKAGPPVCVVWCGEVWSTVRDTAGVMVCSDRWMQPLKRWPSTWRQEM
jgi:hypothetical protein